jgi:RimJ/RimL family protein N-acetyltransferase
MDDIMRFGTERLTVRRIRVADAGFMLALLNDPGFLANIGDRGVRTIEQAEAYIAERAPASFQEQGLGFYRVALRDTDEPVGIVSLLRREGLDGPDLGFSILARHVRRGYAWEAAAALMDHARDRLALPHLLAFTAPDNIASARLLAKLGFRETRRVILPGQQAESRLFATQLRAPSAIPF